MKKDQERSWPASKVELWPIDKIIPYDKNPRTHPQAQIDLIAKSMIDDGVTAPILVDEKGVIIYGHGRRLAALQNGFKKYPVAVAKGWTAKQKNAARIKDNSYGLMSGWDNDIMQVALAQLKLEEYPLELLGFQEFQLRGFGISLGIESEQDPEAVPEVPKKPVVRKGDLWLLGDHRLLCGDATNADDVAKALGGGKPNLLVSDPPYGVDYDPDWRNRADRANGKPYGARAIGLVTNDHQADWADAWKLFHGDVIYAWSPPGSRQLETGAALKEADFEIRQQIIWAKNRHIIGRGNYHYRHEPCWYAVRKGATAHWCGARDQNTVWDVDHQKSETGHSTQKPIECMKRPIENNSRKGDEVYDPFLGSGTTLIACEMTGRKCIGLEIDESYCEVIIQRWQNFTGKEAHLADSGKSFLDVKAARSRSNGGQRKTGTALIDSSKPSRTRRIASTSAPEKSSRESSHDSPSKA